MVRLVRHVDRKQHEGHAGSGQGEPNKRSGKSVGHEKFQLGIVEATQHRSERRRRQAGSRIVCPDRKEAKPAKRDYEETKRGPWLCAGRTQTDDHDQYHYPSEGF